MVILAQQIVDSLTHKYKNRLMTSDRTIRFAQKATGAKAALYRAAFEPENPVFRASDPCPRIARIFFTCKSKGVRV
jgi:hypothetical protein